MPSVWTKISKRFQMCRTTKVNNFPPLVLLFASYQAPDIVKEKGVRSTHKILGIQTEQRNTLSEVRTAITLSFAAKASVIKQKN